MDLFDHALQNRMKDEAPLAMMTANQKKSHFETLSAVLAGDPKERDSAELRALRATQVIDDTNEQWC